MASQSDILLAKELMAWIIDVDPGPAMEGVETLCTFGSEVPGNWYSYGAFICEVVCLFRSFVTVAEIPEIGYITGWAGLDISSKGELVR